MEHMYLIERFGVITNSLELTIYLFYIIYISLVFLDFMFGWIKALIDKTYTSHKLKDGIIKKISLVLILIPLFFLTLYLGTVGLYMYIGLLISLIINEIWSFLETLDLDKKVNEIVSEFLINLTKGLSKRFGKDKGEDD